LADHFCPLLQTHSVFVKNLAFSTTETALKKHFAKAEGLRSVLVKMRPAKNGKALSMGFGFAEFASADAAKKAIAQLQVGDWMPVKRF
jgi:multiple RNA-binding domain-containing protein 1